MLTITSLTLLYFLFGSIIGSFLSVCAYRIPMGKYEPIHEGVTELNRTLSLVSPARSFCPKCEQTLAWWHTIPLVSWLILRGRCGHCQAKIPFRYLFIELLTGALCALTFLRFGPTLTGLVAFGFIALFIIINFIDLDYMIIPDVITYPATFIGLAIGVANRFAPSKVLGYPFVSSPLESLYGLLMGPGLLLAVWWLYFKIRKREGLGLGDVKFLAVVGATFGMESAWFTIFFGSVLGSIIAALSLLARRGSLASYFPFGPYLVIAAIAYLLDLHLVIAHFLNPTTPLTWWIATQL
jgi:leader peptidase (prepilin peptidase)/N-methyltransferase